MSDETSAAISATRKDWVMDHRELYLASGGVEGHIMDITPVGGFFYAPHLLLKYRGRSSGKIFITPLCYVTLGGEVVVCGSKGGADHHPNWYLNLVEESEVEFQVATQAFRGSWREPQGKERDKVWGCLLDSFPFYANYQTSTSRLLPLVMMQPREAIPVFKPEDATGIRQI